MMPVARRKVRSQVQRFHLTLLLQERFHGVGEFCGIQKLDLDLWKNFLFPLTTINGYIIRDRFNDSGLKAPMRVGVNLPGLIVQDSLIKY